MVCFTGAEAGVFAIATTACDPFLLSPIVPFAPAPSCAVKLPILFALVGLPALMFPHHLTTQSLKSLGLCSLPVTAPAYAQHEAAEAHCLGFPLFPLGI
jgi:hypothetical protein